MTAATLPSHIHPSFSSWRQTMYDSPLTPPLTSAIQPRKMQNLPLPPTLPPISYLDRHLSAMPPLTPPRLVCSSSLQNYSSPSSPMLATPNQQPAIFPSEYHHLPSPRSFLVFDDASYFVDSSPKQSAYSLAERACEMICYLWFSLPSPQSYSSNTSHFPGHVSPTTTLQLQANPAFIHFMQKLLETTQVSQSVIVLSLHYIYRLKERNRLTAGQPGSEFRIAVAGLMMANKFLDDNTYTNKTWSEVSGIDLSEINRMEREFLLGIDFSLYVDKSTYESWLNLLKGLMLAKDRASRQFRRSRMLPRVPKVVDSNLSRPFAPSYPSRYRPSHRARSTSPGLSESPVCLHSQNRLCAMESSANADSSPRPGLKRSAADAFSPTSATFSHIPSKRPVSMSLVIPEISAINSNPSSHSPLEPLHSFSKMSIGSSPAARPSKRTPPTAFISSTGLDSMATTLSAAYAVDQQRPPVVQNLYYYSLACSPMGTEEESRNRKARLRYHQPPQPTHSHYPLRLSAPIDIQSASASPREVPVNGLPTLPHFYNSAGPFSTATKSLQLPLPDCSKFPLNHHEHAPGFSERTILSAPFANAGPPGVQFYTTPSSFQRSFTSYASNWSRGRPF